MSTPTPEQHAPLTAAHSELSERELPPFPPEDRIGCGREVWSEDELPLEVAERVIRKRMLEALNQIVAVHADTYVPQITLNLCRFSSSAPRFRWSVQPKLLKACGEGDTLDEALANVPKFKTPEEEKAEKITELRAELSKLESETK